MSSPVRAAVLIFSLLGIFHGAVAEAPGDQDATCRTGLDEIHHIFPEEWEVLVDSYDYRNLYGEVLGQSRPVWRSQGFDEDGLQWEQIFGGICTQSLYTCSFIGGPQENWIFSQFINYEGANEIFFNVSFRFTQCRDTPSCSNDFVTLHRYDADSQVGDRENIENYQLLLGDEDEALSHLQQLPAPSRGIGRTLSLTRPEPRKRGFYLGFRDTGTCGQVERMIVYYTVCRARQNELVRYAKVGTPPRGGPDAVFQAECVANAHNVTNLAVTAFSENGTCMDVVPGGARCECDAGYEISPDRTSCIACPRGNFRALGLSSTCQACPANTLMDAASASECRCLPGFFRRDVPGQEEGPEKECTAPPGSITNLNNRETTNNSITITWNRPAVTGRSDFYYEILVSVSNERTRTVVDSFYQDSRSMVDYTISDLRAFTSYAIFVVTHNGVSGQDQENEDRRTVQVTGDTKEGVPGVPILNRLCTVIIWRPPVEPAGLIVGYEVRFQESSGEVISLFGSNENFHITTDSQREINAIVQIRAVNSAAPSQWTEPLPIDCVNTMGCPTAAPTSVPTTTGTTTTAAPTTAGPTTPSAPADPGSDNGAIDTCEVLTAPAFGSVIVVDGKAQYSCDEGYSLVGDATRECLNDLSWSSRAPTCELACKLFPVHFVLKGEPLLNNSQVLVQDLGAGEDALVAVTDFESCCRIERAGEFYYPNGDVVGISLGNQPFYRNRGTQELRLHRRNLVLDEETLSLLGQFRCEILDGCGELTDLYINIVSS